ncbi:MAG: methylated-DNA-protein-cysteine methyltransferase-like protein [Parvicella sp.]|jgi:methylated-DNA-protein-cysteine methyltransferase-like protein
MSSDLKQGFFADAQAVARLIPEGRVTSYGSIAGYLSSAKAARMVGWAMKASHGDETVPAHRVVNRIGVLSGKAHFATLSEMEASLAAEGIVVKDNQIVNFKEVFWDPSLELKL